MSLKSARIRIAASVFLLLVALGVTFAIVHQHNSLSESDARTADYVAANGISTRADYLKTVQLQQIVVDHHQKEPLTEQQVDWLLAYANNPRFQSKARGLRQLYASGALIFACQEQIPVSRQQNVYEFGVQLVRTPDQYGLHNSLAGCRILSNMGNKDAIPELQPLLQSRNKTTRRFAALALDRLGFDVPPSFYTDHT